MGPVLPLAPARLLLSSLSLPVRADPDGAPPGVATACGFPALAWPIGLPAAVPVGLVAAAGPTAGLRLRASAAEPERIAYGARGAEAGAYVGSRVAEEVIRSPPA